MLENEELFNDVNFIYFNYETEEGESVSLTFTKEDETVTLEILDFPYGASDPFHRELGAEEWENLLEDLFHELFIQEWEERYENTTAPHETNWDLEVTTDNGMEYQFSGVSAYPENWNDLADLFEPYLNEAEIALSLQAES